MAEAQIGSPEQWRTLEGELVRWDLRPPALSLAKASLALGVEYALSPQEMAKIIGFSFSVPLPGPALSLILPQGIYLNNASTMVRLEMEHVLRPLRTPAWDQIFRHAVTLDAILKDAEEHLSRNISMMASVRLIPKPTGLVERIIYCQAIVNQAVIACALERHRFAHGSYPDSLVGLTLANGKPLPLDPFTQKPLHYRRSDYGRYILWSISLNGIDHHGLRPHWRINPAVSNPVISNPYTNKDDGDWVWAFPEDAEATAPPN
jgi:hypothetical protein